MRVGTRSRRHGWCQRRCDHRLDSAGIAEDLGGFGHPNPALLGFGAGFVLRVTGFQGGLLGKVQGLDGRRYWPGARPALVQARVDANDLPDRPLARVGPGTFGEPQPQRVAQMAFEGGVVGLRRVTFALNNTRPSMDSQRPSRL
jgi:hypothetical protein